MKGISGKEWVLLSQIVSPSEENLSKFGYIKAQLLANRGVSHEALDNKLKNLTPPYNIPNIQFAVELISEYVLKGKRIVLFGDYDVDGITGTAMLYDLLKNAGAKVVPLLPSRKKGYGLTKELIAKLNSYADLLITIDNGTTAIEELSNATIPAIVFDHHNPENTLPPSIIVNPKIDQALIKDLKEISSAGLIFYVASLLKKNLNLDVDVRYYLHLACLGTVADVMPMNFTNRIIVSKGMHLLNHILHGSFPAPGIRELMEKAGIRREVTTRDIAFSLVPRLNAPGRIAKPSLALKLLLEKDEKRASLLVNKIEELNRHRRSLSQKAFEEALSQAKDQLKDSLIIVKLEEWAGGVAGIVAGKLSNLFLKPVVVMSIAKDYSTASVRGVDGMDIYTPLKKISWLFLKWGGHSSAAGFTIETNKIREFEKLARSVFEEVSIKDNNLYIDMELPTTWLNEGLYAVLKDLEPFGEGFPEPIFMSEPLDLLINYGNLDFLHLKAKDYRILSWDSVINGKLMELPKKARRIAYKVYRTKPKVLYLVDVED